MRWIKRMCGFAASARSKSRVAPAQSYKTPRPVASWSAFAKRKRCYDAGLSVSSSVLSEKGARKGVALKSSMRYADKVESDGASLWGAC